MLQRKTAVECSMYCTSPHVQNLEIYVPVSTIVNFHNPLLLNRKLLFSPLLLKYKNLFCCCTGLQDTGSVVKTEDKDLSQTNVTSTVTGRPNEIWEVIDVHELFTEALINTFNRPWVSENRQVPHRALSRCQTHQRFTNKKPSNPPKPCFINSLSAPIKDNEKCKLKNPLQLCIVPGEKRGSNR